MSKIRGKGLLGVKVGMTSIFTDAGDQIPVTVVRAGPNTVIGVRNDSEGKSTFLKLGFGEKREKLCTKADLGVFKKAGVKPARYVRELRVATSDADGIKEGGTLDVALFAAGQWVDVVGTSKGKGFAGVVKMHNMAGQGARGSHGVHEYHRHIGAIGQRKTPGRVFPGKRMPGHMGVDRVTIQNLRIVEIDAANHLLLIKGAIPGSSNGLVIVRPAVKPPRVKQIETEKKAVNPMKTARKAASGG